MSGKRKTVGLSNPGSKSKGAADVKGETVSQMEAAAAVSSWGEIITWNAGGAKAHADVVKALEAAGLDAAVAKAMLPRHAWTRACGRLAKDRVINLVDDSDKKRLGFQFNRIDIQAGEANFPLEATVWVDTQTGDVSSSHPGLQAAGQEALNRAMAERTAGDITNIVQRIFDAAGGAFPDLYAIRQQGGCYFVPSKHGVLTDKIEQFLREMGGNIRRFAVPKGHASSERSMGEAVLDGVRHVIAGYKAEAETLDVETTRATTWENKIAAVRAAREKVLELDAFLGAKRDQLAADLDAIDDALRDKAGVSKAVRDAETVAACPDCGRPQPVEEGAASHVCSNPACGVEFELEWETEPAAAPAA